ncbi:MAG: site-specific DNA-methyltransferase [Candidatus Marinimicrobia bacterium]|nr:site-specific DNA-methyltransferase [Candidatus Neomarinimicrobiota bacterium]MBL7047335.1 site-specific DNA-methyltransferase [Candidatus Neomarinimicrobiota bacterium]
MKRSTEISPSLQPNLHHIDWFEYYKSLELGLIDLILTDPPYSILEKHRDWDQKIDLYSLENSIDHVLKQNGLAIIFCNLWLKQDLINSFTKFQLRSWHIWRKPSAMPVNDKQPLPNCEFVLVYKKKGIRTKDTTWNPLEMVPPKDPYIKKSNILTSPSRRHIKSQFSVNESGKRWVPIIIDAPHKPCMLKEERSNHPSQKPESLLRMLIRGYSNKGDFVFDPFAGSGSTLISAYKECRGSSGCEIIEEYFLDASERIEVQTSQQQLFSSCNIKVDEKHENKKILDTQVSGY